MTNEPRMTNEPPDPTPYKMGEERHRELLELAQSPDSTVSVEGRDLSYLTALHPKPRTEWRSALPGWQRSPKHAYTVNRQTLRSLLNLDR